MSKYDKLGIKNLFLKKLIGHTGCIICVAFSPNCQKIASGSKDTKIKIWNSETGVLDQIIEGHEGAVLSVQYSPKERKIASGAADNMVKIWNSETGKNLFTF
jgi:WD40 repeat protein